MKKEKTIYKKENPALDHLLSTTDSKTQEHWSHIHCPNCHETVTAQNIELTQKIGKCDSCHAVFSIEQGINQLQSQSQVSNVDALEGIYEVDNGYNKEIWCKLTPSWNIKANGIAWLSLALIFTLMVVAVFSEGGPVVALVLCSITAIAGLVAAVDHLRRYTHSARIALDDYHLEIQYPYFKKKYKIDVDKIESVQVKSHGTFHYILLTHKNGNQDTIFKSLKNEKQAQYVAQRISQYLNRK